MPRLVQFVEKRGSAGQRLRVFLVQRAVGTEARHIERRQKLELPPCAPMPHRPKRRRRGRRPSAPAPARPTDRSIFSPSPIPLSRFSGWRFVRRALASAAHSIAQRRVPCAPGRPLSLMTFYPPGWECQAGRAFAAVRGRTRRRGGLRNAFTNFVAYAAGSDARRTFRRVPAAEARRPAPEALRGQARGTLGGWKVVGCLRGRLWGEPPGEPPGVTPRPCGARRAALALKNASLFICFFRCISSLFPLFAVLNNICPARTCTGRIGTSPSLLANRLQWPSAQRHHRTDAKSIGAALELLLSALTSSEARLTVAGERAPDRRRSSVRPPPRLPCP